MTNERLVAIHPLTMAPFYLCFAEIVHPSEALDFTRCWSSDSMLLLLSNALDKGALAQCQELLLNGNHIGARGMIEFSKAISNGALPALKDLYMYETVPALKAACEAVGITYH